MLSATAQKIMKITKVVNDPKEICIEKSLFLFCFCFFFHDDITLYNLHKRWPQS